MKKREPTSGVWLVSLSLAFAALGCGSSDPGPGSRVETGGTSSSGGAGKGGDTLDLNAGGGGKGGTGGAAGSGNVASGGTGGSAQGGAGGGNVHIGGSAGSSMSGTGGRPSTDGLPFVGSCLAADHCTDSWDQMFGAAVLQQLCEGQNNTWSTAHCDVTPWKKKCTQAVFGGVYVQFLLQDGVCAAGFEESL